jgi:hypothetical protein
MPMYNVLFGIEANSQKEAEQKALKFQQIVTDYKPLKEQQDINNAGHSIIPSPYAEILGFTACVGLLRLQSWLDSKKPKETKSFKEFRFERQMERRKKVRQEQKLKLKPEILKW